MEGRSLLVGGERSSNTSCWDRNLLSVPVGPDALSPGHGLVRAVESVWQIPVATMRPLPSSGWSSASSHFSSRRSPESGCFAYRMVC